MEIFIEGRRIDVDPAIYAKIVYGSDYYCIPSELKLTLEAPGVIDLNLYKVSGTTLLSVSVEVVQERNGQVYSSITIDDVLTLRTPQGANLNLAEGIIPQNNKTEEELRDAFLKMKMEKPRLYDEYVKMGCKIPPPEMNNFYSKVPKDVPKERSMLNEVKVGDLLITVLNGLSFSVRGNSIRIEDGANDISNINGVEINLSKGVMILSGSDGFTILKTKERLTQEYEKRQRRIKELRVSRKDTGAKPGITVTSYAEFNPMNYVDAPP